MMEPSRDGLHDTYDVRHEPERLYQWTLYRNGQLCGAATTEAIARQLVRFLSEPKATENKG